MNQLLYPIDFGYPPRSSSAAAYMDVNSGSAVAPALARAAPPAAASMHITVEDCGDCPVCMTDFRDVVTPTTPAFTFAACNTHSVCSGCAQELINRTAARSCCVCRAESPFVGGALAGPQQQQQQQHLLLKVDRNFTRLVLMQQEQRSKAAAASASSLSSPSSSESDPKAAAFAAIRAQLEVLEKSMTETQSQRKREREQQQRERENAFNAVLDEKEQQVDSLRSNLARERAERQMVERNLRARIAQLERELLVAKSLTASPLGKAFFASAAGDASSTPLISRPAPLGAAAARNANDGDDDDAPSSSSDWEDFAAATNPSSAAAPASASSSLPPDPAVYSAALVSHQQQQQQSAGATEAAVIVTGFAADTQQHSLRRLFCEVASPSSITMHGRALATVVFHTAADAKRACDTLDGRNLNGNTIGVRPLVENLEGAEGGAYGSNIPPLSLVAAAAGARGSGGRMLRGGRGRRL